MGEKISKVILTSEELEAVNIFIKFLKEKVRGTFEAEVVSNSGSRYVVVSVTNKDRIKLQQLDSTSKTL